MKSNKASAIVAAVLILLPVALYFFLKSSSRPIYNKIPYQYSISPSNGDTLWHTLPEFTLEGPETGETITRDDLLGDVWVIGFIDRKDELIKGGKNIPRPFPIMLDNLKEVHSQVSNVASIKFLLVNTAFDRDSLPQMQALADSLALPKDRFVFANASREEAFGLGQKAFRMPAFMGHQRDTLPFTCQTMALVDKTGRVRKYYIGTKMFDMEKVLLDDLRAMYALEYRDEFLGKDKE
ncbi:MAG: hypothetical protein AB8F95_21965 [Bacteroidia bacterium]